MSTFKTFNLNPAVEMEGQPRPVSGLPPPSPEAQSLCPSNGIHLLGEGGWANRLIGS